MSVASFLRRKDFRLMFASVILALFLSPQCYAHPSAGLPPQIASAGVTVAQWEDILRQVRAQARRAGVAEAALMAAAERAGVNLAASGRFNAASLRDAIINQLETQARTISELTERLTVLARAADPEIANLLTSARIAINEGRLDDADRFLALAEESDLAAIAVAEARGEKARTRLAETILLRDGLERLENPGEIAQIRTAVAGYERALAAMDRALAPNDWARTQFNLGVARALLAQTGDAESRVLAITAFEAARDGFTTLMDEVRATRAQTLADALRPR
jgi:hypothetical protein